MNDKSRKSLKGMAVGFVGVLAVANALSPEMEPWRLLLYAAIMLLYASAPFWWGRLQASEGS